MSQQLHVAIVGAGLGGLAAAISIALAGHRVSLLEQASQLGEVGAGIQIPPNSSRILQHFGILDKIEELSVKPHKFVLRSYKDGKILSTQPTSRYCEERFGAPYLHIHRADYHRVLVDEAYRLGVEIHLNARVVGIDFETPSIKLTNRKTFNADLIIGADGLKSACREALLGKKDPPHLTGDLAYRVTIPASRMLQRPNLRLLIENPDVNYWLGPDSHCVGYLLQRGDAEEAVYNMVLACPDNLPELEHVKKADLREMREFFVDWDPVLREILDLVDDTSKWRLMNSEEMRNWGHESGKFVLLGDACHATLPYLASGAAMAIEDGFTLGLLLSRLSTTTSSLRDILTIFESIRKSRTTLIVKNSSHYQQIFHMHDGPLQEERDRQLIDWQEEPYEGYPNKWRDPVLRDWLWGWDAEREVKRAWEKYEGGRFPLTVGLGRTPRQAESESRL